MTSDDRAALQARWLAEIRRIVADELRGYPVDVYLFGSRARGDAGIGSDVDIAVDAKGSLPSTALVKLRSALEESNVPLFVDVVDLRATSPTFRDSVLREGERWIVSKSA